MAGRRRRRVGTARAEGARDRVRELVRKLEDFCARVGGTPNVRISDISEIVECILPPGRRVWATLDGEKLEMEVLGGGRLAMDLKELPENVSIRAEVHYYPVARERIPEDFEDLMGGADYRRGRMVGSIAATGARKIVFSVSKDYYALTVEVAVP